jgi:transposase, IS30 family
VHLPRIEGYGTIPPAKNGPALGGYGAIAMKDALTTTMTNCCGR